MITTRFKALTSRCAALVCLLLFITMAAPLCSFAENAKEKEAGSSTINREDLSVTEHSVLIDGKPVKYMATTGYLQLKDFEPEKKEGKDSQKSDSKATRQDAKKKDKDVHKSLAKVFFIAYTRTDREAETATRPIAFTFNGGPGAASIWLHMGAMGPRTAVLTERGEAPPPPYRLEENQYSWLDVADLVFIDPVSTGFSRSEPDEDPKNFYGYKADIESVAEFIRLYLTKYKRWSSPKFLVGESYGTTRAAGLSNYLQNRYAINLNGIVLVSSVLNFATLDFTPGNDLPFVFFLPSYASTAWYHKRLAEPLQSKTLDAVLAEAEEFASGDYLLSLFKGGSLSESERDRISARLAEFTGMSKDQIKRLNNRIPAETFFNHLLMVDNRRIGRFDSRYTGPRYFPGTEKHDYDPSFEAVSGPYSSTFNDYVRRELKFESELPYEILTDVSPWPFKQANNRYLNVAEDLRKAMTRNPYLKVLVCSGYYDLATPYFATRYTADQMFLDPLVKSNLSHSYYRSGHMMYTLKEARAKFKKDFAGFVDRAILSPSQAIPTASPVLR